MTRANMAISAVAWIASAMLAVSTARAEEPPATAEAAPDGETTAWQLYDQGFERLAAGDVDGAHAALSRLMELFPDHPAAGPAATRLAELAAHARAVDEQRDRGPDETGPESPSLFARGELAFSMTVHGVLTGLDVCQLLACDESSDARPLVASLMLGGGIGLGASLWLSRDGITSGQAQLFDSAITWGSWNSLGLNAVRDESNPFDGSQTGAGIRLVAQAGGLAIGFGLWETWRPTSGQVALINTGGVWTSVMFLFAMGSIDVIDDIELEHVVVAGDAGLIAGGLIARELPRISRGRTLLIDTGGVLGMLLGGLVIATSEPDSEPAVFAPLFVTTGLGLGLAAIATKNWDVPDPPGNARLGLAPMGHRGWGVTASFTADL